MDKTKPVLEKVICVDESVLKSAVLLGVKAIEVVQPDSDGCIPLYRGKFRRVSSPEELRSEIISDGVRPTGYAICTPEEVREAISRVAKVDMNTATMGLLADIHQRGITEYVWTNPASRSVPGTPVLMLTPFVSLTSDPQWAASYSVNIAETHHAGKSELYYDETGMRTKYFYERYDQYAAAGYKPVIFITSIPLSAVAELEDVAVKKPSEIGAAVVRNTKNTYKESEYVTTGDRLAAEHVRGFLVYDGAPYSEPAAGSWTYYPLNGDNAIRLKFILRKE